jgi:hypothetical protein
MIKRLKQHPSVVLAVAAIIIALLFFARSEEEKILERLEQIRELAELRDTESGIQQAARARQISQHFEEQTSFDLSNAGHPYYTIPSRHELTQRILTGRGRLSTLELAVQIRQVKIDGDSARVQLRGSALGTMRGERQQFLEIHLVEILLRKTDDEWLVVGARHIRDERADTEAQ